MFKTCEKVFLLTQFKATLVVNASLRYPTYPSQSLKRFSPHLSVRKERNLHRNIAFINFMPRKTVEGRNKGGTAVHICSCLLNCSVSAVSVKSNRVNPFGSDLSGGWGCLHPFSANRDH